MNKRWMLALPLLLLLGCQPDAGAPSADSGLVWSDEFEADELDLTDWNVAKGNREFDGWGNEELQYYQDENLALGDGHLTITARKADPGEALPCFDGKSCGYTSGRITTEGKVTLENGRIEARMKVPAGAGLWPAFWLLGSGADEWPAGGEIDAMEWVGTEPTEVYGTIHGPGYSDDAGLQGSTTTSAPLSDDFHLFAVEKRPNHIQWFLDGKKFFEATPASLPPSRQWVFERPFYALLNLAVGGTWPGAPTPATQFPATLTVDYLRIYK
ncbi:glycoside hydrolase family 16 protein [Kribbella sp. NPDC056861]|uniref:glycoside hydrolase family 16 protein n=1 Tax=Kribbella sp. NPDC056861 TaxID=3154857 RepID=UPI00343C25BC